MRLMEEELGDFGDVEPFCEQLLRRGDFEVEKLLVNGDLEVEEELFVEQLLANTDLLEDEPSFFDTFHFSSIRLCRLCLCVSLIDREK